MTVEGKTQSHQEAPTSITKMAPHPIKGKSNMRPERIEMEDGLVMRWSSKEDADNIADLMAEAFKWSPMGVTIAEDEDPKPNQFVRDGVKRLLRGNSGVMTVFDYAVVENTLASEGQNPLIAAVCIQFCPGYYGKVHLQYGKPDAVAVHPDHRNKGLMRRLFLEMIHPASDQRGDVIQLIPGIPHFYRQFGYEYAVGIRIPSKMNDVNDIPPLPEHETVEKGGQGEPFQLRVPGLDDIPYLVKMSTPEKMMNQAELGLIYDEGYWRFNIHDVIVTAEAAQDIYREHRIIVDPKTGKDCGVVMTHGASVLFLGIFVLEEGYSYREVLYPVLRQMLAIANGPSTWELKQQQKKKEIEDVERMNEGFNQVVDGSKTVKEAIEDGEQKGQETEEAKKEGKKADPSARNPKEKPLGFDLDPQHPVMKLMASKSKVMTHNPKFYTRIQSYAKFILTVAPTLEDRLASSCLAGITVTWHFDFFRKVLGSSGKGLQVVFESGKIVSASDDWVPPSRHELMLAARERIAKAKEENRPDVKPLIYDAKFAPLTFTRLLVGDLTIGQMKNLYGECEISGGDGGDAQLMLDILFPKQTFHFDMFWW